MRPTSARDRLHQRSSEASNPASCSSRFPKRASLPAGQDGRRCEVLTAFIPFAFLWTAGCALLPCASTSGRSGAGPRQVRSDGQPGPARTQQGQDAAATSEGRRAEPQARPGQLGTSLRPARRCSAERTAADGKHAKSLRGRAPTVRHSCYVAVTRPRTRRGGVQRRRR